MLILTTLIVTDINYKETEATWLLRVLIHKTLRLNIHFMFAAKVVSILVSRNSHTYTVKVCL